MEDYKQLANGIFEYDFGAEAGAATGRSLSSAKYRDCRLVGASGTVLRSRSRLDANIQSTRPVPGTAISVAIAPLQGRFAFAIILTDCGATCFPVGITPTERGLRLNLSP